MVRHYVHAPVTFVAATMCSRMGQIIWRGVLKLNSWVVVKVMDA
jgi:hypothetical protein